MKITPKVLSIPPYLSTTWKNISSIHTQKTENNLDLIIHLHDNGSCIEIPNLSTNDITAILQAHALYTEATYQTPECKHSSDTMFSLFLPLSSNEPLIDTAARNIQHNPEQANFPPLPKELLEKLIALIQVLGEDAITHLPKPEENCHCVYCQIMNAIRNSQPSEEEVKDEDLRFRDWSIHQTGEKLYLVTHPINETEHYTVFLGDPIGCTCGLKNCEHIHAVLTS